MASFVSRERSRWTKATLEPDVINLVRVAVLSYSTSEEGKLGPMSPATMLESRLRVGRQWQQRLSVREWQVGTWEGSSDQLGVHT